MNHPAPNNDRVVTIQRTFEAPIELVWNAWTQSQHIVAWWGPPGMDLKVEEHDFRVGGSWIYTMMMTDGNAIVSEGVYTEIVPPHRLVTTANFRPMTEGVILKIELASNEEGTAFTFHVVHPTVAYKEQQERMGIYDGWGGAFNRLELFLSSEIYRTSLF